MTSPMRSVAVRLSMDPSAYISGAARAATATTALDREVSKVGATATTSMERAATGMGSTEGAMGKLNKSAGALGFTLGGLAGVGTAVAAALSVKWAGDYQAALTRLATTAGESQQNLGMVGKGMLDMAGQVGIGADELAKGMYTVESGGFHASDALLVLKSSAQGARQENADLGKVTDAVTTILHDYHLNASDAATVTSQLVTAVSHGKTTFDELTGSLHSVTPLASKLNISIADVTGTLSAMTASGMSADQATQNMENTLTHLAGPTNTMIAELAQLGISTDDLSKSLSTRGLAGTLQYVEEAIVNHLDPATQRVLLPALNQSKSAVADLNIMIGNMPPALAKASQSLLDGTTSQGEYRKAAQALGGQAGVMGDQFLSLYKSSDGFNGVLKAGGPAAQVFTAAMAKAFGTTAALNVALNTTGENAAATNDAIKDIAGSAAQADGSIKGWDEVQGNFNQQLAQTEAHAKSLAIEAGQHLLPVLTGALGWINSTGVPAIEGLGGAISDAVKWFMGLPGPVKEAAAALAIVKVLGASDMFAGLLASGRVLAAGLANDMSNMVATTRAGTGQMTAAFAEAKAAQRLLVAERFSMDTSMLPKATGDIAGLGAAAKVAASGGLSMLKSGATGLMNLFGGPWGLALVGATVGVFALQDAIKRHDESIKKATDDVIAWNRAVSLNPGGKSAVDAQQHIADLQRQVDEYQKAVDAASNSNTTYGRTSGTAVTHLQELKKELADGKAQWAAQLAAMTPVEEMQARVDQATKDLTDAQKNNASNSPAVTNAAMRLQEAQHMLALETTSANNATKTQAQLQQDAANAMLASLDASRAAEMASLQLSDAVDQYNKDVADGQHNTRQLQEEQLGLVDSARRTAQAASDAADAQDKQNGITDTAKDRQAAFLKSLQDSANQMSGPAKQAILDMIDKLAKQQTQAQITAGAISALGVTVTDLPSQHLITINAPTQKQVDDLHQLGYVTVTLPDGHVVVTADTHPAMDEINALLQYARTQAILYRATLPSLVDNKVASGSGRPGLATGGWVRGPGTGTSDSVPIMGSNGEFMVNARSAAQHADLLEAINRGGLPGYATGGWIGPPRNGSTAQVPVDIDPASVASVNAALHAKLAAAAAQQTAFTGGGSAGGNAAMRALGQQIAANLGFASQFAAIDYIFSHESGWNPNAQNPTSTAYGIPQFLNSTWAAYGGKTSSPGLQITDGIKYMVNRYGSPNGAAAFWQGHHWYDQGGVLAPGVTMAINGTGKPETIRTFEQERSVQARLHTREVGAPAPVVVMQAPATQARIAQRSAPYVGELHVHSQVDVDLLLREAAFRDRTAGAFS